MYLSELYIGFILYIKREEREIKCGTLTFIWYLFIYFLILKEMPVIFLCELLPSFLKEYVGF